MNPTGLVHSLIAFVMGVSLGQMVFHLQRMWQEGLW